MQFFRKREGKRAEYVYQPFAGYPEVEVLQRLNDVEAETYEEGNVDADAERFVAASSITQVQTPCLSPTASHSLPPCASTAATKYTNCGTQTTAAETETELYITQIRSDTIYLRTNPRQRFQDDIDTGIELQPLKHAHHHRYPPGIVVIKTIDENGEEVVQEIHVDGGEKDSKRYRTLTGLKGGML